MTESAPKLNRLQEALGGLNIAEVIPYLSEEQFQVLKIRFRFLTDLKMRNSLETAAYLLGKTPYEIRRIEDEAIDQIFYLSAFNRPDTDSEQ